MLAWTALLALTNNLFAVDVNPGVAQVTLKPQLQSSTFFSDQTLQWTEDIRQKYDIAGIGISAIGPPGHSDEEWVNETLNFGHRDHRGNPYDGETMVHVASQTKLFTAMSINLLIENQTLLPNGNLLDYNTKVKDILPHWSLRDSYMTEHLDLLDLLSMRSGMPNHSHSHSKMNLTQMIERFGRLRPSAEIRQTMQYNNYHYWILAEVIAHLSGQPPYAFIHDHILEPLGLKATFNHTEAAETGLVADFFERTGVDWVKCRENWKTHDKLDRSCYGYPVPTEAFMEGDCLWFTGPAGLVASHRDVLKWLRELLEPRILPRHRVAKTHECLIPAFGHRFPSDEVSISCYGQATMTFSYRGHEVIYHHGVHPGAVCLFVRLPKLGVGLFITINDWKIGGNLMMVVLYRLLDDLFHLEPIDWDQRILIDGFKAAYDFTEPPATPRPAPSKEEIIGSYAGDGYGIMKIVEVTDAAALDFGISDVDGLLESLTNTTGLGNATTPQHQYIARLNELYSDGYLVTHFDGPLFNATVFAIRQQLDGRPLAVVESYSHTLVVDPGKGVGMFGNFWEADHWLDPVEENIASHAEAWFAKVL